MSSYDEWKGSGKMYLKLGKGEKYECIFRGKEFDPTGGMKQDGAMKYFLEDVKDKKTREMSSSSRAFDDKTSRLEVGDRILIVVGTNSKGGKSYNVTLVETSPSNPGVVDVSEEEDEEDEEKNPLESGDGQPAVRGKKVPF
jgi:hypothetical protein